jgi:hypothetical protein
LAGLAAYSFFTTPTTSPATLSTIPQDAILEESMASKELFQNRVRYKTLAAVAAQSALIGMFNIAFLTIFSVPVSPVVPAMFFITALSGPMSLYYKSKLPLEIRHLPMHQHPNLFGYTNLWKH